jgi:uncharacterized SAM-binding protein YcdF (DUF218 family)
MRGFHCDAIVVLGRGVDPNGRLPLAAQERVARAVALYKSGVAPRIIMSGRCALITDHHPSGITEARAMAAVAESDGVPPSAILLEEESRDTIGNAYFTTRRILEPNGWNTIRVVTSDYHVPRAAWVFGRIVGDAIDVAFSPASSEAFARSIAERARQESAIAHFLMEWLGGIPAGDRSAVDRFINEEHPGYASAARMTTAAIDARVEEIARIHRGETRTPRGHRTVQERMLDL